MPVSPSGVMKGYKTSLRALLGMQGHRPSSKNIAIGKCMKASGVTPVGGGRYSQPFQRQFVLCAQQAGFNLGSKGLKVLSGGTGAR